MIKKRLTAAAAAVIVALGAAAFSAVTAKAQESAEPQASQEQQEEQSTVLANVEGFSFDRAKKALRWQKTEGAQGYIIYRKAGEEYTETARVDDALEYSPEGLKNGGKAEFAIKAYAADDDGAEILSGEFTQTPAILAPDTVTTLSVKSTGVNTAKLEWTKNDTCDGYVIYAYIMKNGVKTLKSTKYISGGDVTSHALTNLPSGSCICAYVKAYTQAGEEKLVSPAYTGKRVYTKLPAVTGLKGKTSNDKSITISWNTQSGVDGYKVYRYNTAAKKWVGVRTLIGSTRNSYKISGLTSASDYKFTVKSYKNVEGKNISNISYGSVLYSTAPVNVTGFRQSYAGDSYTRLQWNAVPRATGYIVYRYDSAGKKWVRVRRTINAFMTVNGIDLKHGRQEKFAVRAFRDSAAVRELRSPGYPTAAASTLYKLENKLKKMTDGYYGDWSIYLKNLETNEYFSMNNKPMYAASTIKLYTMAATYDRIEQGKFKENEVYDFLHAIITVSDNTSFNYLISKVGLSYTDSWAKSHGYSDTRQVHGLMPSTNYSSALTTGDGSNETSARDCGKLLESIYRGQCVSKTASAKMLSLLKAQQVKYKIPSGIPSGVVVANKTGEVNDQSHDTAIVFSPNGDYILCIFCTAYNAGWASAKYHGILSGVVYDYFNN